MTTHCPLTTSNSIRPTASNTQFIDDALCCPISQVEFQCAGAQAPRKLSCCGASIATAALTCILCDLRLPRCPFCRAYLPLHNASDYPVDSCTISKLCTSSGAEDCSGSPTEQCARERLHNDRQISRGCLVGRLREMIAAKMLVTPQAVRLKLTAEHILYVPTSRASSMADSSSKCTRDSAAEADGPPQAPVLSQGQALHTASNGSNTSTHLRQADRHCRTSNDDSKDTNQASVPGGHSDCAGDNADQAVGDCEAAQPGKRCSASACAPACGKYATSQLRDWQPSRPSLESRPSTPPGPEKQNRYASAVGSNSASSTEIRSSVEESEGEESRAGAESLQIASGKPMAPKASADGGLLNAVADDSTGTAVESHRLSAATHASSHETWESTRSTQGAFRNCADQKGTLDPEELEHLQIDANMDTDSVCGGDKSQSGYTPKLLTSATVEDTSAPLSPAALSLLSETTANTDQLSAEFPSMEETKQGTQLQPSGQSGASGVSNLELQTSTSIVLTQPDPSGLVTLDNLHLRFDLGNVAERMDSKWETTKIHDTLVHLDDDTKSLWDCDGRDQCTALWKNGDDKWVLAVTKPQSRGGISAFAQEEFYDLEERDGKMRATLGTRLLMHAYIDVTKVPCQQHRETLQTVLKAQQAASALQHYSRGTADVPSRGDVQQESSIGAPIHAFAFQERICMLVVQHPTRTPTIHWNGALARAGHVQPDGGHVTVGDHDGPYVCMQKVGVTQVARRHTDEFKCDNNAAHIEQTFIFLVGNGSMQEQLRLPTSLNQGSVLLQNSVRCSSKHHINIIPCLSSASHAIKVSVPRSEVLSGMRGTDALRSSRMLSYSKPHIFGW